MKLISSIQLMRQVYDETPQIDGCWADEMKNLNGCHISGLHLKDVLPSMFLRRRCHDFSLGMFLNIAFEGVVLFLHARLKFVQFQQLCLLEDEKQSEMDMEWMIVVCEIDEPEEVVKYPFRLGFCSTYRNG